MASDNTEIPPKFKMTRRNNIKKQNNSKTTPILNKTRIFKSDHNSKISTTSLENGQKGRPTTKTRIFKMAAANPKIPPKFKKSVKTSFKKRSQLENVNNNKKKNGQNPAPQ
jgi:hypothetical protein